jgi:hypothetical protein
MKNSSELVRLDSELKEELEELKKVFKVRSIGSVVATLLFAYKNSRAGGIR